MKVCLTVVACLVSACCLGPSNGASVTNERVKRDGGVITGALISAGASLLTGGGGGGSSTWVLPDGQKINPDKCWQDGSGPCANGNCLDAGRRGIVLKETTVACKWFCFHRSHCKTQICCRGE
ncbi:uncharacterized protein [Panulirus ornatus]|uniref:uncharacterized protein n=1 Tax=Panulirus ornatus TaxID=150431 RepID=UPI003A8A4DA6